MVRPKAYTTEKWDLAMRKFLSCLEFFLHGRSMVNKVLFLFKETNKSQLWISQQSDFDLFWRIYCITMVTVSRLHKNVLFFTFFGLNWLFQKIVLFSISAWSTIWSMKTKWIFFLYLVWLKVFGSEEDANFWRLGLIESENSAHPKLVWVSFGWVTFRTIFQICYFE